MANPTMNINRRSWDDEHKIEVVIKLGVGKTITAEMTAEDFLLAVTGRSETPIELKTRNVSISADGKEW